MNRIFSHATAALALIAAASPAQTQERPTRGVVMPVEYQAANRDHVRLAEQMQAMRTGARVNLDMLLDIEVGAERVAALNGAGQRGRPLRRVVEIGDEASQRLAEVICLTDANAPLNYTKQHYFRFKLFENFEHVTLKVYPGDKADFPANDAACVFADDAPGKRRFHLQGRYQAIVNRTAKGMVVQLRPIR
jgi:hypothetical protein